MTSSALTPPAPQFPVALRINEPAHAAPLVRIVRDYERSPSCRIPAPGRDLMAPGRTMF